MGETNNNQNNNGTEGNSNQNQSTGSEQNQNNQQTAQNNSSGNQGNTATVNEEEIKKQAQAELLKKLGYEDESVLSGDLLEYRKYLDSQKTETQKAQDTINETTKQLAEEREARILAEAKLSAVSMGVKSGLVDDVVLIAKSRATKDKTITAVLTEMKANADEKIYFVDESEEEGDKNKGSRNNRNMTRNKPSNDNTTNRSKESGSDEGAGKYAGTMAARLLQKSRGNGKSYYFKDK